MKHYSIIALFGIGYFIIATIFQQQPVWDSIHYLKIAEAGYSETYLFAFFPFFPFLITILNLNPTFIILLNEILFLSGIFIMSNHLKLPIRLFIYLLTLPLNFFFLVPYTEALFFFISVVFLVTLSRKLFIPNFGIILLSLIRPVATFLVPTFGVLLLIRGIKSSKYWLLIATSVFGLTVLITIQWLMGGEWFAFYKSQSIWPNKLQIPELPLSSWGGGWNGRLDGAAMILGIIPVIMLVSSHYRKKILANDAAIASVIIVFLSILSVLVYRGGSLFSLSRFVISSPFWFYWISFVVKSNAFAKLNMHLAFWLILLYWFIFFFSFQHIQTFSLCLLVTSYLILTLKVIKERFLNEFRFGLLIGMNIFLFLMLFWQFVHGVWIA